MITLRWSQFPESDVASFKIYRSIIGFRGILAPVSGKTLQLKLNGGSTQTFTFDSGSVVDKINSTITGGRAYLASNGTDFFVRSDIRQSPGSVEIVGGTALADLGLTARVILEKTEDEFIASVLAAEDPSEVLEYVDEDGVLLDFYAITTVDSLNNESAKTSYRQPITSSGNVCVLEGIVIDLQGVRVADAEVIATLQTPPNTSGIASILKEPVKTLTGPDGRYSLVILQNALVRIDIPALAETKMITVPEKAYVFLNDLLVDLDYVYPLGYRGES